MATGEQWSLFGGSGDEPAVDGAVAPAAPDPSIVALGASLPASIRLGTSSWSFPGWKGLVYAGRSSEQALARERNAIRQRLETAFFDHRAALGQIVASRSAYTAAREAFRDVRARYQLGLASYTDVSDTIRQLTQAMEGVAESVTLANVSYAQLLRELLPVPAQPSAPVSLPLVLPAS